MRKRRMSPWLWLALLGMLVPAELGAQSRSVTGRVIDATTMQPISNASVSVVGVPSPGVTLTDAQGRFTLVVQAGATRIAVQALGYVRTEIEVGAGDAQIEIALQPDVFRLEEVVVTG